MVTYKNPDDATVGCYVVLEPWLRKELDTVVARKRVNLQDYLVGAIKTQLEKDFKLQL